MRPRADLPRRISDKIEVKPETGCWIWQGKILRNGYGQCWWAGTQRGAHRVVYSILVGPIFDTLYLDHLCKDRRCVNPAHLQEVTRAQNAMRGHEDRRWREASSRA